MTTRFESHEPISDFWLPEDYERSGHVAGLEPWPRPLAGVRIHDTHLEFEYRKPLPTSAVGPELASADVKMLADFADLSRGDSVGDGRLLDFAARYGGLGLCQEHGWPFAHIRPHCPSDSSDDRTRRRERITDWLHFSKSARAAVSALTAKSKSERDAAAAVLQEVVASSEGVPGAAWAWPPYRFVLHWLNFGELRLWFRNRPSRLVLWGVPPLWTALGMEMAMLAVGAKAIIVCSVCGRLDTVKKPSRPGTRSYCSKCRNRGRKRNAATDLRQRKRNVAELRAKGKSIADIAQETGFRAEQVKRYLAKGK